MKRSLKLGFCLLTLLVFAMGCGKDGGGGGGSYANNIHAPSLPQIGQSYLADLNSWYGSNFQPRTHNVGVWKVTRTEETVQTNSGIGCSNPKEIKIFGTVVGHYCASSGSSGSTGNGTSTVSSVSILGTVEAKSANSVLASIMNSGNGTLIDIQRRQTGYVNDLHTNTNQGVVTYAYTMRFQKANGHIKTVVIDTLYHSKFQPMYEVDTETSKSIGISRIGY